MATVMKKTAIGLLAGLALAAAMPAQAETQVFLQAGHSMYPDDGKALGLADVGVVLALPWQWYDGRLTSRLELTAGYADAKNGSVYKGVALPLVRYQAAPTGVFFEFGVGVAYVSNTHWRDDHDLGSHVLFTQRLGVGYDFGNVDLSLNLGHMSNGGLDKENDGADSVGLRFAYTF